MTTRGNLDKKTKSNPDSFSDATKVQRETQDGVDNLRYSAIDSSISSVGTKSDLVVEQKGLKYERDIHTLVGFLSTMEELLQIIEDTKKGISKRGLSKAGKKTMKEAKTKLKQYEKQLKSKKKALLRQERAEIYDNDIANLKNSWQQVEKIREDIGMGQWGEFSNTASYLYNSPETARRSNKRQTSNLEFNQKFQEDLKNGAILQIFNGNIQKANEFFKKIAEGKYSSADYQLFTANQSILVPFCQRYGINIPNNPRGGASEGANEGRVRGSIKGIENGSGNIRGSVDYSNMDWGETFQKGGLAGLFDKVISNCTNMTPGQKNTWKTLGVLGCFAGGIFGLYKFYTNKKMGFWGKAGITGLAIFGSQALTGDGPITLFSKLITGGFSVDEMKNKFGNAISGLSNSGSEAGDITVPAMQSMMIFNSGATVGEIEQMTNTFKSDNKNRRNFYNQSRSKIKDTYGESAMEMFQATFSDNFDEEKWNNWLASFGVTESTDKKTTIYEIANNAHINKTAFEKFLADNKLKPTTDPTKKAELDAYIRNKNEKNETIKLSDLESHMNDRFMPADQPTNEKEALSETTHNIEINNNTLKPAIEKGLSKIFNHFKSRRGKLVERLGINEKNVPKHSTRIMEDIKSKVFKIKGNTITLDLSDNNLKELYDKGIEKIIEFKPRGTGLILSNQEIRRHNRNGLKTLLRNWGLEGNKEDYDKRRNFIIFIFQSLFEEIIPELQKQGGIVKYSCNGQSFNSLSETINSLKILDI